MEENLEEENRILKIPEAVLVTIRTVNRNNQPKPTEIIHHQSGICMGSFVITVGNRLFIPSQGEDAFHTSIYITFNYRLIKSAHVSACWQSQDVRDILSNYFNIPGDDKVIDGRSFVYTYNGLSYFYLLMLDDDSHNEQANPLQYMDNNIVEIGQNIIVRYTPYGELALLNILAEGIICNTFGEWNDIFMIDARLSTGSEGAPVYRSFPTKGLIGMVILNVPFKDGQQIKPSPFYLCVNISTIIKSFFSSFPLSLPLRSINHPTSPMNRTAFSTFNFIVAIHYGWGKGTGFVFHEDGLIMTCAHCVDFCEGTDVLVSFLNYEEYWGRVIFSSKQGSAIDVAVIKLYSNKKFKKCAITPARPFTGDRVHLLGHGILFNNFVFFVSKGMISQHNDAGFIITSCPVLPGSSGGIIIDESGDAVALVTHVLKYGDMPLPLLSYCLPMYRVYNLLQRFISTKDARVLNEIKEVQCFAPIAKL